MSIRARLAWAAAVVVLVLGAAGLYWFQPWKLVTSHTVDEALPSAVAVPAAPPAGSPGPTAAPANVLLASGSLISHEHESSGEVRLIRLATGQVQLTLADLVTSDGPDLRVWLTNQSVVAGSEGWFVFDDDRYVELGPLKANRGNQVYDVPPGTDLTGLTSVTIWCRRFSVSFAAAALQPA
jgi:hypothetical protein